MSPWTVCIRALMAVSVIMALLVLALPENPVQPALPTFRPEAAR